MLVKHVVFGSDSTYSLIGMNDILSQRKDRVGQVRLILKSIVLCRGGLLVEYTNFNYEFEIQNYDNLLYLKKIRIECAFA